MIRACTIRGKIQRAIKRKKKDKKKNKERVRGREKGDQVRGDGEQRQRWCLREESRGLCGCCNLSVSEG